jgi:hypothetical protein
LLRLPRMFVYYDAVVTDSPILERSFREQILDATDIIARINRGSIFLDYLDDFFSLMESANSNIYWRSYVTDAKSNIAQIKRIN